MKNKTILQIVIFTIVLLITINSKSQNYDREAMDRRLKEYMQIDYLSLNYKYLDEHFNIIIPSSIFEETVIKHSFYKDRIIHYKDSLSVVLMAEFNNWEKTRIAALTIGYDWERLGYHTWQSPTKAELFASEFNISHPYRMKEFLIDETNDNKEIIAFYQDLIKKVSAETRRKDLKELSREKLLNVAMRSNPQRIADYEKMAIERKQQREAYQKEHGSLEGAQLGVSCGKKNCCQTKKKE